MYEAAGRAEAEMLVRGSDVANEEWRYQVLNQICSDGLDIEILLSEVLGWLDVAGRKLKEKAALDRTVWKYVRGLNATTIRRIPLKGL